MNFPMKFYLKPVLSVVVLAILLGYAGCGGSKEPTPDPATVALGKLSSTWKVGSTGNVTLDGKSKKADYATFQLTITGTPGASSFGYATQGRPSLSAWPSSGTWTFGTNPETDINRDSGADLIPMTYTVTDTQLELTFTYNGDGESRTSEVKGVWVFTMTK
jgi:hypothetical protein